MSLPSIGHILLAQQQKRRDSFTSVVDMDLHTLLNTNRHAAVAHRNMQYEVPIPITMSHDMSNPTGHYAHQNLYVPNNSANNRIKSENGSERGVSPHSSSDHSRYSSQTPHNNSVAYQQIAAQLQNGMRYPSPNQLQQQSGMSMLQHAYQPSATPEQPFQQQQGASLGAVQQAVPQPQQEQSPMEGGRTSTGSTGLPKAFACSTCQKGFARRSDLARHGTTVFCFMRCT